MGLFGWLERKLFTGDVVQDYGVVQERSVGLVRTTTSVRLCRRSGAPVLVFRFAARGFLSGGVQYTILDARPETVARLREILDDVARHAEPPSVR